MQHQRESERSKTSVPRACPEERLSASSKKSIRRTGKRKEKCGQTKVEVEGCDKERYGGERPERGGCSKQK